MPKSLSVVHYFQVALPKILQRHAGVAAGVGKVVRFVVTGRGGSTWTLRLRKPAARVVKGGDWKADLEIKITAQELQNILSGVFDARRAIGAGNIEMSGDMQVLRQIGFVFTNAAAATGEAAPLPPQ